MIIPSETFAGIVTASISGTQHIETNQDDFYATKGGVKNGRQYYTVGYKKTYPLYEFLIKFYQAVFTIDQSAARSLVEKIATDLQREGRPLSSYFDSGISSFQFISGNKNGYQEYNIGITFSALQEYSAFLSGTLSGTSAGEYSEAIQEYLNKDLSTLEEKDKQANLQIRRLVQQVSPEELAASGGEGYDGPDDIYAEMLEKYIVYRNSMVEAIIKACNKNDTVELTSLLQQATNQVMISLSTELRLRLIRYYTEHEDDARERIILKLLVTTPVKSYGALFSGMLLNGAALLKVLQKTMSGSAKEFVNTLRSMILLSKDPIKLFEVMTDNIAAKPDGKKIFPWRDKLPLGGVIGGTFVAYANMTINDKGRVTGEYHRSMVSGGKFPKVYQHDQSKPENYGKIDLDPLEIITLQLEVDEENVGKEAGQQAYIPAFMLLFLADESMKDMLKDAFMAQLNIAMIGFGSSMLMGAKSIWTVMEGSLLIITGVVEQLRDVLKQSEAGKTFLQYYDIFNVMLLLYTGGTLLVKLPELLAGLVKAWQLYKLAITGNKQLQQLAKIDTEIASLQEQLKNYVNALDKSDKSRVQQRIVAEEARVEIMGVFKGSGVAANVIDPSTALVGILTKVIISGIKDGYLRAKATIQEIKTFLAQQNVYKELAKLDEATQLKLIEDAYNQALLLERLFQNQSLIEARENFLRLELNKVYPQLSPEEGAIIYDYTHSKDFKLVNKELRLSKELAEDIILDYETLLNQVLNKIDNYTGTVHRYTDKFDMNLITRENIYVEHGFMSTSMSRTVAQKFGSKYYFEIKSKTGKNISGISQHQKEQEILFKSGTQFEVKRMKQDHNGNWFILMIEK